MPEEISLSQICGIQFLHHVATDLCSFTVVAYHRGHIRGGSRVDDLKPDQPLRPR